jgi:RNA polymerase sigma factor (sigma-70 family)
MTIKGAGAPKAPLETATDRHNNQFPGLAEAYRREIPRLIRLFRMTVRDRDDADDMAQETFARFIGVAAPASIRSPGGYLTRIAFNLIRDRDKRGSTKLARICLPIEAGLESAAHDDQHREIEAREQAEIWRTILSELPALTLDVFLLNRIDGLTYDAIGDRLGISKPRVQKHIVKALRHIDANMDRADV